VTAHYRQTGQVDAENLLKISPTQASKIDQMNYENSPQQILLCASAVIDVGARSANRPPGKQNLRTWPH